MLIQTALILLSGAAALTPDSGNDIRPARRLTLAERSLTGRQYQCEDPGYIPCVNDPTKCSKPGQTCCLDTNKSCITAS